MFIIEHELHRQSMWVCCSLAGNVLVCTSLLSHGCRCMSNYDMCSPCSGTVTLCELFERIEVWSYTSMYGICVCLLIDHVIV